MQAKHLKKLLSVVDDEAEIYIDLYRKGQLNTQCTLNAVEVDETLEQVTLKGYFNGIKETVGSDKE